MGRDRRTEEMMFHRQDLSLSMLQLGCILLISEFFLK